jgi:hypothetical protein
MEDLGLSYGQVKPKKTKLVFADFPVDIHLNIKEEEQILHMVGSKSELGRVNIYSQ